MNGGMRVLQATGGQEKQRYLLTDENLSMFVCLKSSNVLTLTLKVHRKNF